METGTYLNPSISRSMSSLSIVYNFLVHMIFLYGSDVPICALCNP